MHGAFIYLYLFISVTVILAYNLQFPPVLWDGKSGWWVHQIPEERTLQPLYDTHSLSHRNTHHLIFCTKKSTWLFAHWKLTFANALTAVEITLQGFSRSWSIKEEVQIFSYNCGIWKEFCIVSASWETPEMNEGIFKITIGSSHLSNWLKKRRLSKFLSKKRKMTLTWSLVFLHLFSCGVIKGLYQSPDWTVSHRSLLRYLWPSQFLYECEESQTPICFSVIFWKQV